MTDGITETRYITEQGKPRLPIADLAKNWYPLFNSGLPAAFIVTQSIASPSALHLPFLTVVLYHTSVLCFLPWLFAVFSSLSLHLFRVWHVNSAVHVAVITGWGMVPSVALTYTDSLCGRHGTSALAAEPFLQPQNGILKTSVLCYVRDSLPCKSASLYLAPCYQPGSLLSMLRKQGWAESKIHALVLM